MSNAYYTTYTNVIQGSGTYAVPDWNSDTIKIVALTASYTVSLSDVHLSDITGAAIVATATLATPTITAGAVIAAGSVSFGSPTAGSTITQYVIYKDTGTGSTSPLMVHLDTFTSGMPVVTDGTALTLNFDASGIVLL